LRRGLFNLRGMTATSASCISVSGGSAMWAALFDWDGVIIDSRAQHEESWERLARETGRALPEGHFLAGFGRKNDFIIPEILVWTRDLDEIRQLSLRKESLYREVIAERGLHALPGVRRWLDKLRDAQVPCAIASSTQRANIDLSLGMIGLKEFFAAIVSAEDVVKGKPDPQVFLEAAARVQRSPARCVVFEDAHVGIAAARAGGMRVVAVATTHALSELGEADIAVERLDALAPSTLAQWFSG
jgi:HAD superfamily hydrolase (TIGR01509 family)